MASPAFARTQAPSVVKPMPCAYNVIQEQGSSMSNRLFSASTASGLLALSLGLVSYPAVLSAEESQQAEALEEIVVTGTRLRTDGFEAPTPVTHHPDRRSQAIQSHQHRRCTAGTAAVHRLAQLQFRGQGGYILRARSDARSAQLRLAAHPDHARRRAPAAHHLHRVREFRDHSPDAARPG